MPLTNPVLSEVGFSRISLEAGRYFFLSAGAFATTTPGLGSVLAVPFTVARSATIDYVGINVTTAAGAGGIVRIAAVEDLSGRPNLARPIGTEVTGVTTTIGVLDLSGMAFVVNPLKRYWFLYVSQVAAATYHAAQITRTDVGYTTKPGTASFGAYANCLLGSGSVTSGTILASTQTTWDNTAPNQPVKISVRSTT